jgi:hypothetical protein
VVRASCSQIICAKQQVRQSVYAVHQKTHFPILLNSSSNGTREQKGWLEHCQRRKQTLIGARSRTLPPLYRLICAKQQVRQSVYAVHQKTHFPILLNSSSYAILPCTSHEIVVPGNGTREQKGWLEHCQRRKQTLIGARSRTHAVRSSVPNNKSGKVSTQCIRRLIFLSSSIPPLMPG